MIWGDLAIPRHFLLVLWIKQLLWLAVAALMIWAGFRASKNGKHRGANAFLIFVIGLVLLAIGSHFDNPETPPLSMLSVALFWLVAGAGLLCVLAGVVLGIRAAVLAIRSKLAGQGR